MYKAKYGTIINADVNGSYNIMVKGLNNLGEILNRTLVSLHTRSLCGYDILSNKDLVEKYK